MKRSVIAQIEANSETGLNDPVYKQEPNPPAALSEAGMTPETWKEFLTQANANVKFDWGIGTICGFFCNAHNKGVARKMEQFCTDCNEGKLGKLLPATVMVSYEMETEKIIINRGGEHAGGSATLETFHKLIFSTRETLGNGEKA